MKGEKKPTTKLTLKTDDLRDTWNWSKTLDFDSSSSFLRKSDVYMWIDL